MIQYNSQEVVKKILAQYSCQGGSSDGGRRLCIYRICTASRSLERMFLFIAIENELLNTA